MAASKDLAVLIRISMLYNLNTDSVVARANFKTVEISFAGLLSRYGRGG